MIAVKKLSSGGDKFVEKAIENAAVLGVELIEVLWNNKNGAPRFSVAEVSGFKYPRMDDISYDENSNTDDVWIENTLKFFPDARGNCWGYVYDTEYNRDFLRRSLMNGWFRIVDKAIRDQIIKEAEELGMETRPRDKSELMVKVTKREKEAQDHAKILQRKLEEMEEQKKKLEEELAIASNEKLVRLNKRLKGVKVPNRDAILNEDKETTDGVTE